MTRFKSSLSGFVWIAVPGLLAFFAGVSLLFQAEGLRTAELTELEGTQNFSQARALSDSLFDGIHLIRSEALALDRLQVAPEGKILYRARLEVSDGKVTRILSSARNAAWSVGASIDDAFFERAVQKLNLATLDTNGTAILRIRQDPARNTEWMGFAFAPRDASSSVVFALVDPADFFTVFRRFAGRSEGGSLRAYLVGSDGIVIAHSQKPYVGADFRGLPVFEQAVGEIFRSDRLGGTGRYLAVDQTMATTGYARVGNLPLAVVVERAAQSGGLSARSWEKLFRNAGLELTVLLGVFAALGWKLKQHLQANPSNLPAPAKVSQAVDDLVASREGIERSQVTPPAVSEPTQPELPPILSPNPAECDSLGQEV